jgi:hypothetical protein
MSEARTRRQTARKYRESAVFSFRPCNGIVLAGLAAMAIVLPAADASAQNFFDFFSISRRPSPPPAASAYGDPSGDLNPFGARPERPRVESGPAVSYCVRLCDGRHFPIQRSAATPAQICSSFCPASRTKIFSGSSIDQAVARDGSRYADLDNAFAYRERLVDGCTCNGKDAFGLVNMKAAEDPTLRPGDIVATDKGLAAYSGNRKRNAEFTPLQSNPGLSGEMRRKLPETTVRPPSGAAAPVAEKATPTSDDRPIRRVQIDR